MRLSSGCLQDIFRKYPNRYERIIGALCENLETLDEPEAKVRRRAVWRGAERRAARV